MASPHNQTVRQTGGTSPEPTRAEDDTEPIRVLFVCLGNICRSPTAEAVMADMVDKAGLGDRILVDSAGTGDWHIGHPPDRRSAAEAERRGLTMTSRARQVRVEDFTDFELILAMDAHNLSDLRAMAPNEEAAAKIHLFRSFDPVNATVTRDTTTVDPSLEVPDPYYGGEDGFTEVFDLVEASSVGLLDHIRSTMPTA